MDVLEHELTPPLSGIPGLILTTPLALVRRDRSCAVAGKVNYLEGVPVGRVDPVVSCADPISIGIIRC